MNVWTITGNLGKNPEKRYTDSGTAVTNFSVAVKSGYGDREKTEWVRVSVWGKQADSCAEYLHKGSKVAVSGELSSDVYEGENGKSFSLNLNANNVTFLSPKSEGATQQQQGQQSQGQPQQGNQQSQQDDFDDDVPF